jgi:golgi-specific brefeldin A-resistance guanine nucleotide exchange factor 1
MAEPLDSFDPRDHPDQSLPQHRPGDMETVSPVTMEAFVFPRPNSTMRPIIAIDPVALITTECITITSAMRKNARWAHSSISTILGGGASKEKERDILRSASQRARQGGRLSIPDPTSRSATPNTRESAGGTEDDEDTSMASRWGLRGKKGKSMADNPLLSAFARLRRDLAGCRDISTVDAPELLHPFLQVIRSSSTSAAITSLAVISITKFFAYNIITVQSPRISLAMHLLSAAITHCRFEASDTAADEVVLLRILRLMESIMTRAEGQVLGDESICEMMSTGLSMCCQARLSEVLRRSAEMAMVTMCQVVFGRLKDLRIEEPVSKARSRSTTLASVVVPSEDLKIAPPLDGSVMGNGAAEERKSVDTRDINTSRESLDVPSSQAERPTSSLEETQPGQSGAENGEEVKPYSLPSIKELFRVLIDLLDPHNKTHTDPMRIMALRIIDVALEVAGPAVARQPVLAELVQDPLCRHLFQLVRSDNMLLLNSSLRVAGTLLATCRHLLKLQQELFLSYLVACLHPRVDIPQEPGIDPSLYEGVPQAPKLVRPASSQPSSGRSTPVPVKDRQKLGLEGGARRPEAREAMVENIGTLIRIPTFMIELFVNYDCAVDRQDLCEDMIGLLSRNAFPDAATWSTTSVPPLCLDSLLSFVQFMADRSHQDMSADSAEQLEKLRAQRVRKRLIKSGAAKFNDDPKAGVAYLVRNGIIQNPDEPMQIAQFLKGTSHISKKVLGDFITKKNNVALLTAFISLFRFEGRRIDEALRDMLSSFRLPGESALIERIVTIFVEQYFNVNGNEDIADKDAGFVLTYAIIMLNTDLFNPNASKGQKRMGPEDFSKNLRGVNSGNDFAPEYLHEIYDAIKENEIILPDEHDNKHAFDYAWKELLMKTHDAGSLELCTTNAFDSEMFRATWKPIIATLNYVFMSASDDAVFSRVVVGFDQCAQLAARYGITEAFDRIVYSLSQISGLAAEIPPSTSLNTEVQAGKRRIMVSELAVRLGRDFRAQLSTVLLFRILTGHEFAVGETWIYLVRILRNLFVNSLISLPRVDSSRVTKLDPIPLQPPSQVIDRDGKLGDTGIFSTFTSYLSSYAADDPPEPSEEELENTLSSVDCIKACHPGSVISHMFNLPPQQTQTLVYALLSHIEESTPVVTVKPERPLPVTTRVNGHRQKSGPDYDPGTLFLLEFATTLTLRDQETVKLAGEKVAGTLHNHIRDASNLHPVAASRIVHYFLNLLQNGSVRLLTKVDSAHQIDDADVASQTHDFIRAPVVLHSLNSYDDAVLGHTATAITAGLSACIATSAPLRNEITNSPDFWSILQRLHQHRSEAEAVFKLLSDLASAQPTTVTADNYEAAVNLANDFASAGKIGGPLEQRRQQAQQARRGQQSSGTNQKIKPEDNAVIQRALKAVAIIYNLTALTPTLISQSHLDHNEAWAAYWSPIFRSLCAQCINPCREVRHRALSALQRVLLSEDLAGEKSQLGRVSEGHQEWTAIFTEVLFPLILRLLKPEVYQLDPAGMSETRVQAATLLCKIFLRYLDLLAGLPPLDIGQEATNEDGDADKAEGPSDDKKVKQTKNNWLVLTWSRTLSLLDRMLNSGVGPREQEAMLEAVTEGVKNCLLVMAGGGYLVRPGDESSDRRNESPGAEIEAMLWKETARRVERVVPGLLGELFPAPAPDEQAPADQDKGGAQTGRKEPAVAENEAKQERKSA